MELNKKKSEVNLHAHNAREKMAEEGEKKDVMITCVSYSKFLNNSVG